jgi:uncharacterized NAD(P)/FAD-binding protein YdhS
MTRSPKVVAVIGGGASGALTAIHLLRSREYESVRVVIIEPRAELGRGVAFGTSDLHHLLNNRTDCLSGLPEEPGHFTEWAGKRSAVEGTSFVPRAWYGDYLGSLMEPIEHVQTRAVDVVPDPRGARIYLSNGSCRTVDHVVLAPGASPPVWPTPLEGCGGRWINDPWLPGAIAGIRPDDPVLLVGTGLTAVDVALSLHAAGHRQIIATSRHGLLPARHPEDPTPRVRLSPPSQPSARDLLAWARRMAPAVGGWGPLIDSLRPHNDELWSAMLTAEKSRCLRLLQRKWEIQRHRMAPEVATRIETMMDSGQLCIVRGGVKSVRTTKRGIDVMLADRRVVVGAVVNCSGPCSDVRRSTNLLVRRLLERGLAHPGPLNLGIDTDSDGCLPDTARALWLVGPLRRGRHWETTAIPEIRSQAATLSGAMGREDSFVGV